MKCGGGLGKGGGGRWERSGVRVVITLWYDSPNCSQQDKKGTAEEEAWGGGNQAKVKDISGKT